MVGNHRTIQVIAAVACLGVGAAACGWLISTKPVPPKRRDFSRELEVAAISILPRTESTPVVGHGTVRAKHQVKIVPQVSGQLVSVHENLAVGKLISERELLFEIDSTVYESQVRQAEAEIRGLEASLARSDRELANLDERIANVVQMLAIDEKDYATSKQLYEVEKVGTERELDLVYQKYLRQKDALIELESRRSVIPHLKLETQARLDAARARLKRAKHDLENTKIFCPFDARVELVAAYRSQFVTAHFSIATLTDMSAFELSVGIDPRDLRWLAKAIRPHALEEHPQGPQPEVTVRWSLHGQDFTWRGFVTRFERVDEATRTARLVVEVRHVDMVASVSEGSDEPASTLAIGMHCRAELPVAELAGALLVPRHAVYDNRWVYVFEPDPDAVDGRQGRLGQREVPVLRSLGDAVLVDYADREGTEVCELKPGERVVISPLSKPVVGMHVRLRDGQIASSEAVTLVWPQQDRRKPTRISGSIPHQLGLIRGGG